MQTMVASTRDNHCLYLFPITAAIEVSFFRILTMKDRSFSYLGAISDAVTCHMGRTYMPPLVEEKDVCFEGKSRLESKRCLFEVETIIV